VRGCKQPGLQPGCNKFFSLHASSTEKTEGAAVWQGKYQAAACWLLADGEGSRREDGTPGTRQRQHNPATSCNLFGNKIFQTMLFSMHM
jgi:hypothetical protein